MERHAEILVKDGLCTIGEAMDFLSLKRSSIYKLMSLGLLPYCKVLGSRRIPRKALIRLAAERLVGSDFEK